MAKLTDEQRKRIEENRQKALMRLQDKKTHPNNPAVLAQNAHRNSSKQILTSNGSLEVVRNQPSNSTVQPKGMVSNFYSCRSTIPLNQTAGNAIVQPKKSPQKLAKKVFGNVSLLSASRFEVDIGYDQDIITAMKLLPSKSYDPVTKRWNFDLSDYSRLFEYARKIPTVEIKPLPSYVVNLLSKRNGQSLSNDEPVDLSILGDQLLNLLMPFQREGILFGIRHNGRVLIADDMGLGKTIQAIGLSAYYVSEWPLLVMVPSSVKFVWKEQLIKWLPGLASEDCIQVIGTAKEQLFTNIKVVIVSYEMVIRRKVELSAARFRVAVLDESHIIKASGAARTKAALEVLKNARRVILLSGTPALSRPNELFTQLQAVRPDLFSSFKAFGDRYCDPKVRFRGAGQSYTDYSGSSNMRELQIVMEHVAMIRRIKKDVLDQLPAKIRQVIVLDESAIKSSKDFNNAAVVCKQSKNDKVEFRAALLRFFHETAKIKLHAVRCYISDLLQDEGKKFVVFAHHMEMLDAIEHLLNEERVGYIRIDGNVSSEERLNCIHRFSENDDCRVSLLSITAAAAGINMSAASLVIFAELFWNPGILVQAEDRCHRIGQQNCVNVQYLIAKNTSDDDVWSMIQKKLETLSKAGLTKESFSATSVGKFAAKNQTQITDYIHPRDQEEEIPAELFEELTPEDEVAQDSGKAVSASQSSDNLSAYFGDCGGDEDFLPMKRKK